MAHYAYINEDNEVVDVIVGRDETDLIDGVESWEDYYSKLNGGILVKRTSYNGSIRGQMASVGDVYDPTEDRFYTWNE